MRKPVIIDCDPGHDDAIALLLAFANDKLDVKAVTTVAGNQTIEKTFNNALKVLSFAGINTVVSKGAEKPLLRDLITAPEVHGDSGLDGPELPPPNFKPSSKNAVETIMEVINESNEKITIIPTGPLTNIATVLLSNPEIKAKIERIVLMGGSMIGGNWTPAAEFNILVDPEAASIVFNSGVPITMCGLDVTHKAQIYKEEVEEIRNIGNKVAIMVAELLDFYGKFHERFGFKGMPLHDPVAVAYVIDPTIVTTQSFYVEIEIKGEFTNGCTVVDYYDVLKKPKNVEVVLDIDRERFIKMLYDAMRKYN
ncbi:pyrimidine-specific ribonucleoside hydrolase [Thermoanaerobacter thermohydrosulfuricus]|uniref:Pyrimidine-specific ribonucleoside hydrolase n=1 Tax=Thermoanaerobacter thermohydrosulfuricus TaxID=1516 RepID=A0A1G7SSS6_THETY|nr:pyrimidine-specific ribonucleoside hydrolase RihA [Thermoanaerobacter thermohydrosulfuricus]SDG25932.1 pyrimidine-specific ribonucleoside hydrolase [Thermoanaerobacter thermohydrosulfuricus]